MRVLTWVTVAMICIFPLACGTKNHSADLASNAPRGTGNSPNSQNPDSSSGSASTPSSGSDPDATPSGLTYVNGFAEFGSQCPYGSFYPPQPVSLELWNCPIGLSTVDLQENLPPIILQADCKLKTIDFRSVDNSFKPSTWEAMPDGSFYVIINAGVAKFKDDGSGDKNCSIPMTAYLWGKLDCTDRDKVAIQVETVWRLGETVQDSVGPSPMPSSAWPSIPSSPVPSRPTGTPSALPGFFTPTSWPTSLASPHPSTSVFPPLFPTASPQPILTPTPLPSPLYSPFPLPTRTGHSHHHHHHLTFRIEASPIRIDLPNGTVGCKLPTSCYFHNITQINQCS